MFKPPLTRKLVLLKNPDQRITNEATEAVGELLRQFVLEARHRASIEAEFESGTIGKKQRTNSDDDSFSSINYRNADGQNRCNESPPIKIYGRNKRNLPSEKITSDDEEDEATGKKKRKTIRTNEPIQKCLITEVHILKIAAELLMDFS